MRRIAAIAASERRAVFHNTAMKLGLSDAIVEKDFWVCWTLDHLFHESPWKDQMAFKGGTSLSKCYGLIKRFSEDIDLILDWRTLGYSLNEPWEKRSNTKQDEYCMEMNNRTAVFLAGQFVPRLMESFQRELGEPFSLRIDAYDPQTVCFDYPKCFQTDYVLNVIRLEIGPLAAWTPAKQHTLAPYAADEYGHLFHKPSTCVLTVAAERTFWEKVTILHKEAFRVNENMPPRYSRHYYDLYCMDQANVKQSAYADLALLERVVAFKKRFYRSNAARYDLACPGSMRLMPPQALMEKLESDYIQMGSMIFGDKPSFAELMQAMQRMEDEINHLS